jgi:signal transduction histidine kinase
MEAIGRLADSIVHDFNNLMAVVSAQSELVLDLKDLSSIRQETEVILTTAEKAAALTKQLLAFSRKQILRRTGCLKEGKLETMTGKPYRCSYS